MKFVFDTNVFVAAGFNQGSSSAALLEAVRDGRAVLVWDEATRAETRAVLRQIPPLSWQTVEGVFSLEGRFDGPVDQAQVGMISDPDDRKFAELATAAGAVLVTNDDHLLSVKEQLPVQVLTPREAVQLLERGP
jgi:uncharacterized protein